MLSTKPGREALVEPVIEDRGYRFTVRTVRGPPSNRLSEAPLLADGEAGRRPALGPKDRAEGGAPTDKERIAAAKNGTKLARGANFQCVMSGTPIAGDYIKAEGKAGRMGARLMAIVAEGDRGRVYLAPTPEHEAVAREARPAWKPDVDFFQQALGFRAGNYGMTKWSDLFTDRQLVALTTFSDLVQEARARVQRDALAAGLPADAKPLRDGGIGATAYAEAVDVYWAFALSKQADLGNSLCGCEPIAQCPRHVFGRQALPMLWDYAEGNPLGESSGAWVVFVDGIAKAFSEAFEFVPSSASGLSQTVDAGAQSISRGKLVSTDPPYYDNIGYADLSDFFYVWRRRSLRPVFPDLFATLAVPKAEELVATPYRHGSKEKAETFFLDGMTRAMHRLADRAHPGFPVTIYYAFKQSESETDAGTASTGWETFLDAVIRAGFAVSGTWPMRTEMTANLKRNVSALASSIILVCRPRSASAPTATRRDFVTALKAELPVALAHLQRGNIAPVDLAQAAIGPGMAVYTRYEKVLDAEGKPLTVREALALINQTLDEALAEQEGDFDADTRWALAWFEQSGFDEGEFGVAEVLSKAKVTSVAGMVDAGVLASNRGKVRLLRPEKLRDDWDPSTDARLTVWEMVHHLVRALDRGEAAAADLVAQLGSKADTARELAYRLYTLCERKKRATEALSYNALVQSWPELVRLARESAAVTPAQGELL
jgi:putative DNA methylase